MRRFVLIGQKASATPDFSLDDVPGTSGRLDVLLRCVRSALLVSHGLRRDTLVYLVLYGGGRAPPRSVRIDSRVASYMRPDERTMAGRVRAMLATKAEGDGFAAERQGMAVADGGLEVVLADLGAGASYVLDEAGADIRDEALDLESPVFFVGDHLGFDPELRARLDASGARSIRVGPVSLHADDAIAIVRNELDRRGPPFVGSLAVTPPLDG
jgi:tRNA (pseudouridine54-N1)-methyltransferase